jgi:hypothetical protein
MAIVAPAIVPPGYAILVTVQVGWGGLAGRCPAHPLTLARLNGYLYLYLFVLSYMKKIASI